MISKEEKLAYVNAYLRSLFLLLTSGNYTTSTASKIVHDALTILEQKEK